MKSFQALDTFRDNFLIQTGPEDPENFPFLLIGNKLDLANAGQRVVQETKARTWCSNRGDIPYIEASAKESVNVESAFLAAARRALEKEQEPLSVAPEQVIDITQGSRDGGSGGGCCGKK